MANVSQSYPLLPPGGVLNYDFKLAFNLNLTTGFSLWLNSKEKAKVKQLVKPKTNVSTCKNIKS